MSEKLDEKFVNAKSKIDKYYELFRVMSHCLWNYQERMFPIQEIEDFSDEHKQKAIAEVEKLSSQEMIIPKWIKSEIRDIQYLVNDKNKYGESTIKVSLQDPNKRPCILSIYEEDIPFFKEMFKKILQ